MLLFAVLKGHEDPRGIRLKNSARDFLGVNFWSRDYFTFCRKSLGRGCLGVQ